MPFFYANYLAYNLFNKCNKITNNLINLTAIKLPVHIRKCTGTPADCYNYIYKLFNLKLINGINIHKIINKLIALHGINLIININLNLIKCLIN
jgi:hypothetical protein